MKGSTGKISGKHITDSRGVNAVSQHGPKATGASPRKLGSTTMVPRGNANDGKG